MAKKEYIPTGLYEPGELNQELNKNVLNEIKKEIYIKLYSYDCFIPVEYKRNIEDKSKWHSDVVESLFNDLNTLNDLSNYLVFSLKNEKLGIHILRVNKSPYCLCAGLLNGWCNCTKDCYAGKLEHFQLVCNLKNYIFLEYVKKIGLNNSMINLLNAGIVKGVNKAIKEAPSAGLSKIKAIRNNEAGEIEDLMDLRLFEYIYSFIKNLVPRLKDYTYSTNPHLLKEFKNSQIVVRHSIGFDYSRIENIDYPSLSCIINNLDDLKTVYELGVKNGFKVFVCGGSCKKCLRCIIDNSIIVFVNHSKTTGDELEELIKEAQAYLKDLKAGALNG